MDRPPNVLLVITDQQRWDTLGYTGRTPCRTPHLDRLAREGVAFDRCLTPDPICSPARAALFTGRYPHATGVGNNYELPLQRPALPEVFREAGYHVAYSGKWHLGRGRGAAGFDAFAVGAGQDAVMLQPRLPEIRAVMQPALDAVFGGTRSVEDALRGMKAPMQALLQPIS